jgi:tRNA-specific 2-thiouridylase
MQLDYDFVATGHHARVGDAPWGRAVARGVDTAKDQSYVLYMLQPAQLERVLLPIGEMTKADVRSRAHELGLRTADKHESMDVCFITRGGRKAFLGDRIPRRPGRIVDTTGAVVGAHDGLDAFTVGQRRGLDVAVGERRYVVDLARDDATVTVGTRADLLVDGVVLRDATFASGAPRAVEVQTRAHGAPVGATLDGDVVHFASPQPRVAPGQVVACYVGDAVVGGGTATNDRARPPAVTTSGSAAPPPA